MRQWLLSGLLFVLLSSILVWITGQYEILVFVNLIVGIISMAIAFYIHIGLRWYYRLNEIRNNHEHADYKRKNKLKYKLLLFGIPNLVIGGIVNNVFDIWV